MISVTDEANKTFMKNSFTIISLILFLLCYILPSCNKEEVPALTTSEVTNITGTSATSGGNVTSEGSAMVLERGICWSTATDPTLDDNKTLVSGGAGTFTSNMTDLQAATEYYVRAYATNSYGTGYGESVSFKTSGAKATITKPEASELTGVTAKLTGTVNPNYMATAVVFEYGTTNSYGQIAAASPGTIEGSKVVTVYVTIQDLLPDNTYYYRIRATNQLGTEYSEGNSFKYAVSDGDGNSYNAILIGTQMWLATNLKTTKLNDGTSIQPVTSGADWATRTSPSYCWYDNTGANGDTYGALYNWYSASSGKLCPAGWHVPTDADFSILISYLGGSNTAGGKMKEAGPDHWITPNTAATNESKFRALPGGFRDSDSNGTFKEIRYSGYWWTSTAVTQNNSYSRSLNHNSGDALLNSSNKAAGFSVRCIKD
jgi:uncharacterized protein (TIGR02145 family)